MKKEKKQNRESHLRSLIKGMTWRTLGTLDTMFISWLITGNWKFALSIGGIEIITKFILYYFHERAWQLVPRGTIRTIVDKVSGAPDGKD